MSNKADTEPAYVAINMRRRVVTSMPKYQRIDERNVTMSMPRESGVVSVVEHEGYLYALLGDGQTRVRVRFCPLTGKKADRY